MDGQTYWDEIGHKKDFEDPFPLDRIESLVSKDATIVEYGCGYGRILSMLQESGYSNLTGYDYSSKMIERGRALYPNLSFTHIPQSGHIPLPDHSADFLIASTILCSLPEKEKQVALLEEFKRVLKKGGHLFVFDFLLCEHPTSHRKYEEGFKAHKEWGVYTTSEGLKVRHATVPWVMELLKPFEVEWFKKFDFKTMNHNPARTFHCLAVSS